MKAVFLLVVMFVSIAAAAEDRAVGGQKKTAAFGGVTVTVTPLNLADRGTSTIDFQLVMDTHSGALPSDMRTVARLIGEDGSEIVPLAWSGGGGGHHLSGSLSFPAAGSDTKGVLTLVFKSADGRSDMRFEWIRGSKSANNIPGGTR